MLNNKPWLGNWSPGTPPDWTSRISLAPNSSDGKPLYYLSQYSVTTHTDFEDCTSCSFVRIVYCITGRLYSQRALAKLSGNTLNGNTFANVLRAANNGGLIPEELWPSDPAGHDFNSYMADIPQDVLDKADRLTSSLVAPDLNISPIWTELEFNPNAAQPGPEHAVCQINITNYDDSEIGNPIKPLDYEGAKVVYQTSIVVAVPDHLTTETSDPVTVNTPIIP